MTTEQKGEIAQLKAHLRAAEKGYVMSRPTIQCRYDAIIDDGTRLLRAQIKYGDTASAHAEGAIRLDLRKRHKSHYDSKEIDVLLVYIPKIDRLLAFQPVDFEGRVCLDIRFQKPKNNQSRGIRLAQNFIW